MTVKRYLTPDQLVGFENYKVGGESVQGGVVWKSWADKLQSFTHLPGTVLHV